jgi:hypothetical protein
MRTIEKHILDYGYRCVLFRTKDSSGKMIGKNYLITESGLLEVKLCHEASRAVYIQTGRKTNLRNVKNEIRLVFDRNGVLIARKVSPRAPLRLTGKGMGKLVAKEII